MIRLPEWTTARVALRVVSEIRTIYNYQWYAAGIHLRRYCYPDTLGMADLVVYTFMLTMCVGVWGVGFSSQ